VLPYSGLQGPIDDLWDYMDAYEDATGGRTLAIPHNSNLSNGLMFELTDSQGGPMSADYARRRSEEHTSELQSRENLVCRLLLEQPPTEVVSHVSLHDALPICPALFGPAGADRRLMGLYGRLRGRDRRQDARDSAQLQPLERADVRADRFAGRADERRLRPAQIGRAHV